MVAPEWSLLCYSGNHSCYSKLLVLIFLINNFFRKINFYFFILNLYFIFDKNRKTHFMKVSNSSMLLYLRLIERLPAPVLRHQYGVDGVSNLPKWIINTSKVDISNVYFLSNWEIDVPLVSYSVSRAEIDLIQITFSQFLWLTLGKMCGTYFMYYVSQFLIHHSNNEEYEIILYH